MIESRRAILRLLYDNCRSEERLIGLRTEFTVEDYLKNRFNLEYLRAKGYISYIEPGDSLELVGVQLTIKGVDFIEDIEDIVPARWK